MTKARTRWENEKWWERARCNSPRGLEREDEKNSYEQRNHSDAHHKAHSYRRRKIICRPPRVMNHPGIVQPLDFCLRRQAIYRDTPYWRKIFTNLYVPPKRPTQLQKKPHERFIRSRIHTHTKHRRLRYWVFPSKITLRGLRFIIDGRVDDVMPRDVQR